LKKIPIGVSDFKKLITENCYFVDKTLMIKELIDSGSEVTLITRPRRFGKTMNMSMLRYFFENTAFVDGDGKDNLQLFDNLDISMQGEKYLHYAGKFPVIFLTLKNIKGDDFESCYKKIEIAIVSEYERHKYLLTSDKLDAYEKEQYIQILTKKAGKEDFEHSLSYLSNYLYKHYGSAVIILIDEYDTPIQNGYNKGYFEKITDFT
jgi:Predicted AAA-ATPase.